MSPAVVSVLVWMIACVASLHSMDVISVPAIVHPGGVAVTVWSMSWANVAVARSVPGATPVTDPGGACHGFAFGGRPRFRERFRAVSAAIFVVFLPRFAAFG